MFVQKIYSMLLSLYPPAFRAQFGDEMVQVFLQAASEHRSRPLFIVREMLGLVTGAAREWAANREAVVEDITALPSDIAGVEKYRQIVSQRLIHAIANHDFAGARLYDEQDRKARQLLDRLRAGR